ncbi:VWA domain-containing protein [bacterium]|nr:VWA domain-containing protein [bacterium]
MLSFGAPLFALAGILAAAGPVIVHLLNRRRFRVVAWGAMDFLRQAMQRQRKAIQLRDLLLLLLRVLAVLLFGLALARPYLPGSSAGSALGAGFFFLLCLVAAVSLAAFATLTERRHRMLAAGLAGISGIVLVSLWGWSSLASDGRGLVGSTGRVPVHAILVIDNSRSMGAESAAGSRLDQAKELVRQFLSELPAESRITLIPVPGLDIPFSTDAFTNSSEALRALNEITVVDAADNLAAGLDYAEQAARQITDPESKRVVLLSDWQSASWQQIDWPHWSQQFPGLQLAHVSDGAVQNVAVAEWVVEDGLAGAESETLFRARLAAHHLSAPVMVTATFRIDDVTMASQVVELSADQTRELEFSHRFEVAGEPGRPQWNTATIAITTDDPSQDRLLADNSTTIVVPVLDAVPVVFIDEYGSEEDAKRGRIGETYALRHLLAPRIASDEAPRRLIHIEHVRPENVTEELLETARLVVMAGVQSPEPCADVLREYVQQGGPLAILAGGDFDPQAWLAWGWRDGQGILPLPLGPEPVGSLPTAATKLHPFFVDFASLQHRDFLIEGEDPETLAGLFETTPFFKAIPVLAEPSLMDNGVAMRASDLRAARAKDGQTSGPVTPEPTWWRWRSSPTAANESLTPEQQAERERPRVLARYTNPPLPWVVERQIGAGTVLFFSSGVTSDWNLLRSSSAMYVFHRALFRLMSGTLAKRNLQTGERFIWPQAAAGHVRYELRQPDGRIEPLAIEALGANLSGLVIRQTRTNGVYAIQTQSTEAATTDRDSTTTIARWSVQAPTSESELMGAAPYDMRTATASSSVGVLEQGEPIRLEGGSRRGERLWRWSILASLFGLCGEMLILGTSGGRKETA